MNERPTADRSTTEPRHEGGLKQVVRDRANFNDSPLGALVRFLRDLKNDAQRRSK